MRIISGRARGRRLRSPQGKGTRPTSDRVRESLFSMLGPLEDAVVFDGFAGTGALGLEAWSRGARKVVFAEPDRHAASVVRENIELLGAGDDVQLLQRPFDRAFMKLEEPLDLVFLDPPYDSTLAREALELLATRSDLLNPGALVVWESSAEEEDGIPVGFTLWKTRSYGSTKIRILLVTTEEPEIP